jgi:hypothetical protein
MFNNPSRNTARAAQTGRRLDVGGRDAAVGRGGDHGRRSGCSDGGSSRLSVELGVPDVLAFRWSSDWARGMPIAHQHPRQQL